MSTGTQGSFSNKLELLRKSTLQDEQLTRLKGYISTGFPCDKKNLPTDLHEFWLHKEVLSIESGLIICGNRTIVPRGMRPEMLQYIHKVHSGEEIVQFYLCSHVHRIVYDCHRVGFTSYNQE